MNYIHLVCFALLWLAFEKNKHFLLQSTIVWTFLSVYNVEIRIYTFGRFHNDVYRRCHYERVTFWCIFRVVKERCCFLIHLPSVDNHYVCTYSIKKCNSGQLLLLLASFSTSVLFSQINVVLCDQMHFKSHFSRILFPLKVQFWISVELIFHVILSSYQLQYIVCSVFYGSKYR